MKALIVILLICTIGLGIALMKRHTMALVEKDQDLTTISELSNTVASTSAKLDDAELVNERLSKSLTETVQTLANQSNQTVKLSAALANSQAQVKTAEGQVIEAQKRIEQLTGQIEDKDKELTDKTQALTELNTQIEKMNQLISDTERKLNASEGDRSFLLTELKRLQTEKADLERQFNDLAKLRSQISRLREELSIARRIEWIRSGIYGNADRKGAEKLLLGLTPDTKPRPGFDLNVEIRQDGGATVNTNPPAAPK